MPATQIRPAYSYMPPTELGRRIISKPQKGYYMQGLKEIRCKCCNKLLARTKNVQFLEIKCVRCKTINKY
ncbi:Com family DNA-binding transcriptional regulator [Actinobacillus succinogenes]